MQITVIPPQFLMSGFACPVKGKRQTRRLSAVDALLDLFGVALHLWPCALTGCDQIEGLKWKALTVRSM
jgi:hypothetical protein